MTLWDLSITGMASIMTLVVNNNLLLFIHRTQKNLSLECLY